MTTDTEALTYDHIVALALEHGFKLKPQVDGRMALNDYVIDFARAVYDIGHAAAKAETAAPVVGRWYFVTNDGAATLCVDEADARESAAEADIEFPRMAPHRAVQLVPADQLAEAQRDSERLDWMIEQCAYVVSDPDCCDGYWLNYLRPDGTVWTQATEHETPRAAIDAAKGEPS